jgi:hypothetical protein
VAGSGEYYRHRARQRQQRFILASIGKGDAGYELQMLDSYNNPTYVNGQSGSIYKQFAPLVNANLPPGQWQSYDVAWKAPRFNNEWYSSNTCPGYRLFKWYTYTKQHRT